MAGQVGVEASVEGLGVSKKLVLAKGDEACFFAWTDTVGIRGKIQTARRTMTEFLLAPRRELTQLGVAAKILLHHDSRFATYLALRDDMPRVVDANTPDFERARLLPVTSVGTKEEAMRLLGAQHAQLTKHD